MSRITTNKGYSAKITELMAAVDKEKSEDICRLYRNTLYDETKLGDDMKNNIDELRTFVIERYYNGINENDIIEPDRRALLFTTEALFKKKRTSLEGKAGTSTTGQCRNSIGRWINNRRNPKEKIKNIKPWIDSVKDGSFKDWEHNNCWLCGLPLIDKPVDCEHKLAMLIMMLIGAGLKKTKPRGTGRDKNIQDSNEKKRKIMGDSHLKLPIDWKILVRAEGYGWSHGYCNQYKSQMPFISLKYKDEKYEYIIEINNILQYLAGMFNVSQDELKDYFPWYSGKPYKEESNFKGMYEGREMKTKWRRISQAHINPNNKKVECVRAFYNIIDMLIPTYFLLNVGPDIEDDVKEIVEEKFKDTGSQKPRTFIDKMENFPIAGRLQDNIGRILGWLNKKDNSQFKEWLEQLNLKDDSDKNPISKYFNEQDKPIIPTEGQGVLELFRGNLIAKGTSEDAVDDDEELIDMVKADNSMTTIYEEGETGGMALGKIGARSLSFDPAEVPTGEPTKKRSFDDIESGPTKLSPEEKKKRLTDIVPGHADALEALMTNTKGLPQRGLKGGRKKRTRRRRKRKKKRSKRKKKRRRTKKKRRRRKKRTRRRR